MKMRVVWPFEKSGAFSVRSAYHLVHDMQSSSWNVKHSSSYSIGREVWTGDWYIHRLPK